MTNYRYYKFSSVPDNIKSNLFENSIRIIQKILHPLHNKYTIDSYRAGGWSIQPFSVFKDYFIKYGITNDFSVVPGKYLKSDAHDFDFRRAPLKYQYQFDDNIEEEDINGLFTEWSISCVDLNKIENWVISKYLSLLHILKLNPKGKGSTVNSQIIDQGDIYISKFGGRRILASFEGLDLFFAWKNFKSIYKNNYFQFISHPKLLTNSNFRILRILFFFYRQVFYYKL